MTKLNKSQAALKEIIPPQCIHFASIGRPHGLKGAFFLKTPDRRKIWDGYKSLFVETPQGFLEMKVNRHYLSGDALALELEGLSTREQVELMYDKKICVHKSQIQLKEDEYLVHDLLQFQVLTPEKGLMGHIISVVSYGAQENFEIKMSASENVVLYPFVDKYILNIDYEKKQIVVEYIEEFFS